MATRTFKTLRRYASSSNTSFKAEPSPEQMEVEMKAFTQELNNNKQLAKEFFQKVGIISGDGKLTEAYKSKA